MCLGLLLCVIPDQIFPLPQQGIKLELHARTSRTVSHLHDARNYRFMTVWNGGAAALRLHPLWPVCNDGSDFHPKKIKKIKSKRGDGVVLLLLWRQKRLIQISDERADELEPRENVSSSDGRERLPAASLLLQFTRVFQSTALLKWIIFQKSRKTRPAY